MQSRSNLRQGMGRRTDGSAAGSWIVRVPAAVALVAAAPACGGADSMPGNIVTIAGTGEQATQPSDVNADGIPDAPFAHDKARFDTPMDAVFGPQPGTLYILDWNGHKIRCLGQDGMVAFVVGTGIEGDACERPRPDSTCPLAASELNHMTDIAFDGTGRMVIAAWHNAKIKRANMTSDALLDLCGNGARRFVGDGGPCFDGANAPIVSFDLPSSVVFDGAGNLFVADQANQVVRRIGTDGIVTTVVGSCPMTPGFGCPLGQGYHGDGGPATAAALHNDVAQSTDPQGKITLDAGGNLYIADTRNNVVRKVVPGSDGIIGSGDPAEEIITTIAGTGTAGYAGDGGPAVSATLNEPHDVAVGPDGSLYVADTGNNCVRRVLTDGTIATAAGRCGPAGGFSGDGGAATRAELNRPYGIAVDGAGNLIVTDTQNNRVRKVFAP